MLGFGIYLITLAIVLAGIGLVSALCYICVHGIDKLYSRYEGIRTHGKKGGT